MGRRRPPVEPPRGQGEPDDAKTCPNLLDRVRDWDDHPAWADFYDCYNRMLRRWCGRFSLDADASDELCQRIWVELMARMRTFRYDPSRGFRKWLWMLFRSRAIDLLRRRRVGASLSFEDVPSEVALDRVPAGRDEPCGPSPILSLLAEEAQAAVRARVDAETWRAYWIVAIEDRPIREAAEALDKSYTAIYTGYKRVDRMLRAEGERRLAALLDRSPES
jgi:RNA polymerase sigma-70 factor (ECF subfamily)